MFKRNCIGLDLPIDAAAIVAGVAFIHIERGVSVLLFSQTH